MTLDSGAEALFDRSALRERRREAIIKAAAVAFNRSGFHNTSMEEIAGILQTSKPTLYQFFKNKQKLLHACHVLAMDYGESGLEQGEAAGRSGREKLEIYARTYMHGVMTDFGACAILSDVGSLLPEDRKDVITRRKRISRRTQDFVEEGMRDGSIAVKDAKVAALFVLGILNWILIWYRPDGERTREEIVEGFLEMMRSGFAPR